MARMHKFRRADFFHKRIVIDNSVLMKAFVNEERAEDVRKIFAMFCKKETSLLAPPLIIFEFLNALSKSLHDSAQVTKAMQKFEQLGISLVTPRSKYLEKAIADVCKKPEISYYDASYHALARDVSATFLTADAKYYEAMKDKGNIMLFV